MMMNEPQTFTALRGELAHDVPLARYTSWRCGGPGDRVYVPADREDLATFIRQLPPGEPLTTIGLGSNLLVRDGGIRGTVVVLHAALNALEMRDGQIYAEAGVASPKVARFAATHGCADAEFLAGIPGTVGGALAMNAGCYGGETWRFVARVEVLTRDGMLEPRLPSAYATAYRSVRRADGSACDGIFTAAWFAFPQGDGRAARARIAELLRRVSPRNRWICRMPAACSATPPAITRRGSSRAAASRATPSAGHACRRSTPTSSSTRGAGAQAADIESIIAHVRAVVRAGTGIDLEPEVQVIGEHA